MLLLLLVESAARATLPAPASDLMEAIMVNEDGEGWGCLLTSVAFGRTTGSAAAYLCTFLQPTGTGQGSGAFLSDSLLTSPNDSTVRADQRAQTGCLTRRTVL